jgi:hypothetical protein
MSTQERSLDQQHVAAMDAETCVARLQAFAEGRLFIWSDAEERQDSSGNVYTLRRSGWRQVRGAFAIFVRNAKYKIAEKRWRVPTDEDAKRRPVCRARDAKTENWKGDCILVAVCSLKEEEYSFFVQRSDGWIEQFVYCEIEEESNDAIPQ